MISLLNTVVESAVDVLVLEAEEEELNVLLVISVATRVLMSVVELG